MGQNEKEDSREEEERGGSRYGFPQLLTMPLISGREHNASWGDFASRAFDVRALEALENKYKARLCVKRVSKVCVCLCKRSKNKHCGQNRCST